MSAGGLGRLLRDAHEVGEATFLELFFDLAFVFAISRVSQALFVHLSLRGSWDTTEIVFAMWWTWLTTVWMTEALDADHLIVQALIIVLMFGALVLAASAGGAYAGRAMLFSVTFVAIRLVRGVFLLIVTRRHELAYATLFWAALTAPLWLVGGPASTPRAIQEPLWAVAIILDYAGAALGWPLPGRGRTRAHDRPVAAGHLAERCRQFIIIGLGETVLTITARFGERGLSAERWVAFTGAFVLAVLLWRIYIYRAGELLHHAIAASRRPTLFQHGASFAHLIMVVGIVFTNAALRATIHDPLRSQHTAWTVVLVAGPAIFLAGRSVLEINVFGRLSAARPTGMLVILAFYPLAVILPQIATLTVIDTVLVAIAIGDAIRWQRRPVPVRGTTGIPPA